MHLEVSDREREAMRSDIRPVREPRFHLFREGRKSQPLELAAELIPEMAMTANPSARVPGA